MARRRSHLLPKPKQTWRGRRFSVFALMVVVLAGGGGMCVSMPGTQPPGDVGRTIATATLLDFSQAAEVNIFGTITGDEARVYDLGPFSPGDRIIATVNAAAGSTLDPTAAVFDGNEELIWINDDVDLGANNLNSRVDFIVVENIDHYYLAIAKFFLDAAGGDYTGSVRVERGGQVPVPEVQTLLLNFAGGPVTITSEGAFEVDPFDSADIDAAYAGQTDLIKARIVEVMLENFEDTGLRIVSSDDNPALDPGTFTTMHFGAFSPTKFGVADSVDVGNFDRCDDGIVFTNSFDTPFAVQPTALGIATAIANVAAHEAGHLLGLNHTSDVTDLMDSTGSASTLLEDQDFKTAELHVSIFPFGLQNGPRLLDRVVPPQP